MLADTGETAGLSLVLDMVTAAVEKYERDAAAEVMVESWDACARIS